MSDNFLQGRTALVTGATSGIGLAIAKSLAGAGARLAINGLGSAEQIAAAVADIESSGAPEVRHFVSDLRDVAAIELMMAQCAAWNAPSVLVNCAGIQHPAPLADMPAERWDAILSINLSAAFHTMRLALPAMAANGFGRVINVASVHGLIASINKAPYVASKFGLIGLSKVAALEYATAGSRASGGVTVNCVCPGWVDTPMIEPQIEARSLASGGTRDDSIRELLGEKQPSLRMSMPEEIAELIVWLCRPAAHNLTGTAIPVDGGWTSQ